MRNGRNTTAKAAVTTALLGVMLFSVFAVPADAQATKPTKKQKALHALRVTAGVGCEVVGSLTVIPMLVPYFVARVSFIAGDYLLENK